MKKVLFILISAFTAMVSKADVMNWQVADDSLADYDYAKLYWSASDTLSPKTELAHTTLEEGRGDDMQIDITGISNTAKWFFVEVGHYQDNNFTAYQTSTAYSYSDLVSAGLISTGSMDSPSGYSFGDVTNPSAPIKPSYSPVPEPGTAGLILLGLAVAGLKRRRV